MMAVAPNIGGCLHLFLFHAEMANNSFLLTEMDNTMIYLRYQQESAGTKDTKIRDTRIKSLRYVVRKDDHYKLAYTDYNRNTVEVEVKWFNIFSVEV